MGVLMAASYVANVILRQTIPALTGPLAFSLPASVSTCKQFINNAIVNGVSFMVYDDGSPTNITKYITIPASNIGYIMVVRTAT